MQRKMFIVANMMSTRPKQKPQRDAFNKAYYDRYYHNPVTRVSSPQAFKRQGEFLCSYLRYIEQPVRRVVDLGCGIGRWKKIIHQQFPRASYTGIEVSDYLCKRYGWEQGSVIDYSASRAFDLVICQDVIQYLDDAQATRALQNLSELCRGAMHLTCMTREDWSENCDQDRTDGNVHLRSTLWYRKRLAANFVNAGGGLFIHRDTDPVMFELECLS